MIEHANHSGAMTRNKPVSDDYLDEFVEAYADTAPYALDNRLMLNWYADRIANIAPGRSLLELGLGHGHTTSKFSTTFAPHVVVEGSKEVIERFRSKHPANPAQITHAFFEHFETSQRFNCIVMGFVLEHVEDPLLILHRYKQFLNDRGSMFVVVPNAEALNKRIGYEAGMLASMMELNHADRAQGHRRLYTVRTLTTLLHSAGYRIKHIEGIFLKPITTQQIIQLRLSEAVLQAMLSVGVRYPELCVGILVEACIEE